MAPKDARFILRLTLEVSAMACDAIKSVNQALTLKWKQFGAHQSSELRALTVSEPSNVAQVHQNGERRFHLYILESFKQASTNLE